MYIHYLTLVNVFESKATYNVKFNILCHNFKQINSLPSSDQTAIVWLGKSGCLAHLKKTFLHFYNAKLSIVNKISVASCKTEKHHSCINYFKSYVAAADEITYFLAGRSKSQITVKTFPKKNKKNKKRKKEKSPRKWPNMKNSTLKQCNKHQPT